MPLNVLPIVRKEFRQVRRDRRTLGVLVFIPSFMLMMFGYAVNFDVRHTKLAVVDEDRSARSREFANLFTMTEYFDLEAQLNSIREADALLDKGAVRMAIVIPEDFSDDLAAGRDVTVQVLIDGSNASASAATIGYMSGIIQDFSVRAIRLELLRRGQRGVPPSPIDLEPRIWYNPELRSAKFLVPGLIAFIMMVTAVISTALSIAREREMGTMEQLMVSPVRPVELILGKTIPYTIISIAATVVILAVGYLVFGVEVKGSMVWLSVVSVLFLVGGLGIGLLISTIAESQQIAFMVAVIVSMLPTFVLSGFVFPIRNMPGIIQVVTYLVPARYFLAALRAIILKGVGIGAFWEQLVFLTVYAGLALGASSIRMKRMLKG
jgi:ABC-2 type transport system permease protein